MAGSGLALAGKPGVGKGKSKILFSCFFFQQSRVAKSGLAPAGKPEVGKGKGKIVKILMFCFLFSSPGWPDQDWHRLASRGWARGKVR